MKSNFLFILLVASIALSCQRTKENSNQNWGFSISSIDTTVRPVDDFFEYINGGKIQNMVIPPSEVQVGSFVDLNQNNQAQLYTILNDVSSKSNPANTNAQRIADYYMTAMDSVKLNNEKALPLKQEFNQIEKIVTKEELIKEIAHLNKIGVMAPWEFAVNLDQKDITKMSIHITQGGLGMFPQNIPDRDYYLRTDANSKRIQQAYRDFISHIFQLLGDNEKTATKSAALIYDLETKIAKSWMTPLELRDPEPQYNKMNFIDFQHAASSIDWNTYFKLIGISNIEKRELIVTQPLFLKKVNELWKTTSLDDWKIYLRWHLVVHYLPNLSDDFVKENFQYYGTTLSGVKAMRPRWKRALRSIDDNLGEALGQLYVEKYFPEEAKKKVNEIVDNLTMVFEDRIKNLDWMSDSTKKFALLKLKNITRKLGYPDKWEDYSRLTISRDSYTQNKMRAEEFHFNKMIDKLDKPVDKTIWQISPQVVNAYYEPSLNEIAFPAGILQFPFFDVKSDDAINYGCIGGVIGHELTHAFDDQGGQYDKDGNLKNWWTKEDWQKFKAKTKTLVRHYDQFVMIDTFHVNGKLTLGENIADLGGLTVAYYAFKKSLEKNPLPENIDGFTPEQRFFIGWAQGWCVKERDEFLKSILLGEVHAPGKARVNVLLSNMPEFYDAFGVKPGDKMYREESDRVRIW